MIYDDVRERAYSLPTVAGGAALLVVLGAIVTAVLVVSQSSVSAVHPRKPVAVRVATTAALPPAAPPVAPPPEGRQFFGEVAQVPLFGQALPPVF